MRRISLLLASAAILPGFAFAQDTKTFRDVETIEITDFIGTVSVRSSGNAVRVVKSDGTDGDYPFDMDKTAKVVTLSSEEDPTRSNWQRDVKWRLDRDKAFENYLKAYPTLEITIPRGTALVFDSAVVSLSGDDTNGLLKVGRGYVDGEIGDISEGQIKIHGSADLTVGDVEEALSISIHGSGDFAAKSADIMTASIHGSGDIDVGDIGKDVDISIHGSGDIVAGEIGGNTEISIHGSGDVETGKVGGGAETSTHGSGDIALESVNGPTSISINGSGDTRIGGGVAEDLRIRIHGSGDARMDGRATNPNISVRGSGSAYVAKHDGPVRVNGRGDIVVSGVRYKDDD